MKKLLMISTAVTMLSGFAYADGLTAQGLDDPEVVAPAAQDWTGPYLGLSYGRTETSENTTKCLPSKKSAPVCDNVTTTAETSADEAGAFVGYRHDFGSLVLGAELGQNADVKSLEVQAGLDLNKVLVYGFGGVAKFGEVDGSVIGLGADLSLTNKLFVGVKHTQGEFDTMDTESTVLRVGLKF